MSRCEKFGYGVMVTQVAATAPGVVALHSSGTKAPFRTNKHLPAMMLKACVPSWFCKDEIKQATCSPEATHLSRCL